MNAIGNDNYRPNMTPPMPIKRRSGWLSSNMAQLMVFLNGLILTVTAFATLSVFIQEIIKEDFLKTTNEVQEYISSSYERVEETLSIVNGFVEILETSQEGMLVQHVKEQISGLDDFEEIFWVQKRGQVTKVTPILKNNNFRKEWQNALVTYELPSRPDGDLFFIDGKHLPKYDSALYGDVSAVVKTIENDHNNYVVGLIDSKKLISSAWLEKKETIIDLQVVSEKRGEPVFNYRLKNSGKGQDRSSDYVGMVRLLFAGDVYNIQLSLDNQKRESFLQKIPLLMFLFGVTLTLIGTLYVRSNQNQSEKLSVMNKELAHKNYELHQEMSERERLNSLMKKSDQENKSIINSVSDIIFELSTEGAILFINDSWRKVTGFELESSVGNNFFDLLCSEDKEAQKEDFTQFVKRMRKSYCTFTKLRCSNGEYRTVEITFSMLRQNENKELHAVGTITDVEERRRTEKALGEAEKKYQTIVENAAAGLYQVTPEGQFLSANPSFAKIIGYDAPEDILREVINAQEQLYIDVDARNKILKEVASARDTKQFELQITRKDGSVIWVSENIRPVHGDDGSMLFYEGSIEDIDQRKKAELALKGAKVESDLANRAKSEFLTNMSHELRTPLNSVIGFAEIIKNEAFGALPQTEYKEYAENIFNSGNQLLNVINEILDVSHIEAGDRELKEGVVNIKEIVAASFDMMKGKLDAKKIRIDNKVINESLNLIGEKQAVKQMLLNLLSNAIRFSPEQSYIMVDAEVDREGRLRLSVTDTGVGLTEKELEKALSPFGQVNTEHKREKSGTGLGLTLVKSLVELHGGELEMVSQKNIGTTATLTFPEKRVSKAGVTST